MVPNAPSAGAPRPTNLRHQSTLPAVCLLCLGALLLGLATWHAISDREVHVRPFTVGSAMATGALFLLIVGRPLDPRTGKVRTWANVGTAVSFVVGATAGGFVAGYLSAVLN
jgi:hypothetical protein